MGHFFPILSKYKMKFKSNLSRKFKLFQPHKKKNLQKPSVKIPITHTFPHSNTPQKTQHSSKILTFPSKQTFPFSLYINLLISIKSTYTPFNVHRATPLQYENEDQEFVHSYLPFGSEN
jgi:hypothetical protein